MFQPRSLGLLLVVAAALVAPATAFAAPPPNDAFATAQELTGRVVSVDGLNKDATKEVGEPDHAGEAGGASIWYRWTAPADGHAVVSTCESSFDTVLAVYTGAAVDALTQVPDAANNDGCGVQSRVAFDATESVTYQIAVDGDSGATGAVVLALRLAPSNDDFEDAQTIAGDEGSIDGTTVGSTRQDEEPDWLYSTVWYAWTAPSSGPANFEVCGSDFESYVVAFSGDDLGTLTYVAYGDDACLWSGRMSFTATGGVTYRIVVDGYSTGDFSLSWNRNPPPPAPPYARDYPWITGTPREGETLTASEGEWAGTPPVSFAYAWGRCNSDYERCDFIAGAVSRTYVLTTADVGHHVYVRITGTNVAGSSSEYSDSTPLVRPSGPVNTAPPLVSGRTIVGETLNASDGSWSGPTPIQFAYQWQACDAAGAACVDLQGERLSFIVLRPAQVGRRLRVVVTGTNVDGSRSVTSEASAAVVQRKVTKKVACVVPNVRGKSLKDAKSRIRRAHCKTGRVTREYSRSVARGRVIAQKPKAGARMKQGAPIKLVVSKGRRR